MPEKSLINRSGAPPADQFPAYPSSWYLFCESADLGKRPLSKRIFGQQLVAFRTASGQVSVLDARCSHLGADLGCGRVVGETIQCPYHHWRYGRDGSCTHIPGASDIPAFASQRRYPVEERHGHVFVFNGREALFPLPFILGENPDDFVAARPFSYVADCTWYMNSVHAFDRQHFAAVHDRKLIGPPRIDRPAPFARRNSYRAEVVGHTIFDRLLRVFAGRTVDITLTIWGGTFAVITGEFERVRSAFLMSMLPVENSQTLCEGVVLAQRSRFHVSNALGLWTRRMFTHGYLADEARRLRGTRYTPNSLMPQDQDMIDFFNWVVSLPQEPSTTNHEENDEETHDSLAIAVPHVARLAAGRSTGRSSPQ